MEKMMEESKVSARILSHSGQNGRSRPHLGYPLRKQAAAGFRRLSRNTFELVSNTYHGDDCRHRVLHLVCGHVFNLSLAELEKLGYRYACPYCSNTKDLPDDLQRFISIADVQEFVISNSLHGSHFMAGNHLGKIEEHYRFYCLRDHEPYETTFKKFLQKCGSTNDCPLCNLNNKK